MDLNTWLIYLVAATGLSLSPGPNGLLALTHGDDYPVSQEISELTLRVEQERRQARGVDRLDEALRSTVGSD